MKIWKGYKRGINLGGWLSQCKHTLSHYDSFIKKEDIERIAKNGYDHIRLPIDYEVLMSEDGEIIETGFLYIRKVLCWCHSNDLNLILDLHKTKGYTFDDPGSANLFFQNEQYVQFFIDLWEVMALRFGKEKGVAFELLNEIVPYEVYESWNRIVSLVVARIRKIAKEVPILIGGVCYNSVNTIKLLNKQAAQHIVYNFHCYEPFAFTHQGAEWVDSLPKDLKLSYPSDFSRCVSYLAKSIEQMMRRNKLTGFNSYFFDALFEEAIEKAKIDDVPLYCGEYGVIDGVDKESKQQWLLDIEQAFSRCGIGHARWNYKGLNFSI